MDIKLNCLYYDSKKNCKKCENGFKLTNGNCAESKDCYEYNDDYTECLVC